MRKRTQRRHRAADPGAFLRAIGMQQQLDDSQQVDLTLAVRVAAQAMRSGAGMECHVDTLASAVNVALILCERGAGKEYEPAIIAAQTALMRTIERGKRTGRWGFDGPALAEVDTALAIYEAQLAAVPRIAARDAVREVTRRLNQGHVFEVVHNRLNGEAP